MTYDCVLTALADPTRRALFERIAQLPSSVGELAEWAPITQPAVSQHLRVLREAGLVEVEVQGTRHVYHPRVEGLEVLRAYLNQFWDGVLQAFERAAAEVGAPAKPITSTQRIQE